MKNIALALLAALAIFIVPIAHDAVLSRLDACLAWDSRHGFDFQVNVALELALWRIR